MPDYLYVIEFRRHSKTDIAKHPFQYGQLNMSFSLSRVRLKLDRSTNQPVPNDGSRLQYSNEFSLVLNHSRTTNNGDLRTY